MSPFPSPFPRRFPEEPGYNVIDSSLGCSLVSANPRGGSGMLSHIPIDRERIASFCRRHHIRKLAFFGSVLRADFRPDSDVDVLVDFEPGHAPVFESSIWKRNSRSCWAATASIW